MPPMLEYSDGIRTDPSTDPSIVIWFSWHCELLYPQVSIIKRHKYGGKCNKHKKLTLGLRWSDRNILHIFHVRSGTHVRDDRKWRANVPTKCSIDGSRLDLEQQRSVAVL